MLQKLFVRVIALYLAVSLAMSLLYNIFPSVAWDLASHRHGLLVVSVDHDGVWVLNPFSRAADDWIFGFGGLYNAD